MGEIALRFVLGGVVVSLFAAFGEVVKPKSFAGMFGAAPSVAIATLGLAFVRDGDAAVAIEARWAALACVAMFVYCTACIVMTQRVPIPVWLAAAGAWITWFATAGVTYLVLR
jgi:uncharacterized membrane protein (GlpM family)